MKSISKITVSVILILFSGGLINCQENSNQGSKRWFYCYEFVSKGVSYVNINGRIFSNAYHLNSLSEDVYSFIYKDGEKYYANISGKIFGPFDYLNGKSKEDSAPVFLRGDGTFSFLYSQGGRKYINANGKLVPVTGSIDPATIKARSDSSYAYSVLLSPTDRYAVINGKKWGPFPNMAEMMADINKDKSFYFEFSDQAGNYFINVNGKTYRIEDFNVYNYNYINYHSYKENGKCYLCFGGKISGPYDELFLIDHDFNNGEYIYRYRTENKWFVNRSGETAGPFDKMESAGFSYFYNDKPVYKFDTAKGQFINIDGKSYGPYGYIKCFSMRNDSSFSFACAIGKKWYLNINGEVIRSAGFGLIDDIVIKPDGTYLLAVRQELSSRESYIFNGKYYNGPYSGYIEKLLYSDNGKTIVLYTDKGTSWINYNGINFGGFSKVSKLILLPSGEFAYSAIQTDSKEWLLQINNKASGMFQEAPVYFIGEGGRSLFYFKKNDKYFVSLNNVVAGPFDEIKNLKTFGEWR